jgi:TolB-like protein
VANATTQFWKELRRRKVFKVAVAYAVVAWLVIQVASTIAPQLNLPEWAPRFITFVVLLGFPVALVLAWTLEKTPDGVKVEPASVGNKRMFAIAAVLVALAIGWYWKGRPEAPDTRSGAEGERSIAVLPFVNMSDDEENEFFSDGISEEILNSLAQMPDLRVAARTSSFSFKGQQKEIPEIARELNVRMVLEGSVRKQDDRVRITAQLVDAETGFHAWSQTYDRELKDIFAIQDEIARAIAGELQVKLGAAHGDGATRPDTTSLEAYDAYLKGLPLFQERGRDNLFEAERLFRSALALDPRFAKAWAGLAMTLMILPEHSLEPLAASWSKARDAAEYALALEPTLPDPYLVLGYIAGGEFRFDTSHALFDRALELAPSFAMGYQWYGRMLTIEGDFARAYKLIQQAVSLDPKAPIMHGALVVVLRALGRDDEAVDVCLAFLAEWQSGEYCERTEFNVAVLHNDYPAARVALRRLSEPRGSDAVHFSDVLMDALEGKGDPRVVAERLAGLPDGGRDPTSLTPLASVSIVIVLTEMGFKDLALDRARQDARVSPYFTRAILLIHPQLHVLACEPEFQALAQELQIDEARAAELCRKGE